MSNRWKDMRVSGEDFEFVKSEINRSNRQSVMVITVIAVPILLILTVLSLCVPALNNATYTYGTGMVLALSSFLIVRHAKTDNLLLTRLAMYILIVGFLLFGLVASFQNPAQQSVTFHVVMLIIPCLFVDKPWRMLVISGSATVVFCLLVTRFKIPSVQTADLINGISFGILAEVIGQLLVQFKVWSFRMERKNQYLSTMDLLTNLRNRNSYEERLEHYDPVHKPIHGCVYIDVNGLHEMNNKYGHKAGDRMLQTVAQRITEVFETEDAYRIGGDEFVVFVDEAISDVVEEQIAALKESLIGEGHYVSIGYESRCDKCELVQMLKNAEQQMYHDKQHYYETHKELDRRKNR